MNQNISQLEQEADVAAYINWTLLVARDFSIYYSAFNVPIGLLSNLCQITVFCRKKFRGSCISLYYIVSLCFNLAPWLTWTQFFPKFKVLSVVDMLNLIILSCQYLSQLLGRDFGALSDVWCKLFPFIIRVLAQMSSWITVMITYDRLIYVVFPQKFRLLSKKKFIASLMLFMTIFITANCSANFWYYRFYRLHKAYLKTYYTIGNHTFMNIAF